MTSDTQTINQTDRDFTRRRWISMANVRISSRLLLLIVVQALVLVAVGGTGYLSMQSSAATQAVLNDILESEGQRSLLGRTLRTNLLNIVEDINAGRSTWEEAAAALPEARARFDQDWSEYLRKLPQDTAEFVQDVHGPTLLNVSEAFDALEVIVGNRDRGRLDLFMTNDFKALIEPYVNALQAHSRLGIIESQQALAQAQTANKLFVNASVGAFAGGLLLSALLGVFIYFSISSPVAKIADTVRRVTGGDMDARSGIAGRNELGELGQAFDQLLDDKMRTLAQIEQENEALNNSVITLLQAVSQLSQRDLTVRVPVSEDVTGPVADALNLLTNETAGVLQRVQNLSDNVAAASSTVKTQSETVVRVADTEHTKIVETTTDLASASEAMNEIAELAQACNSAADKAIEQTRKALETVTSTVTGINNTRDTIHETEKRIKRLGERSQEISGAVNLINNIAERTHILALNASMHAASAGEAGRGFAVVADEVQRLAESAREATSQIADLVSNIQTETADTVATMNATIAQVVEGSQLAEQAGQRMTETQEATVDLVAAVQQIAAGSQTQAAITKALRERARQIEESTNETRRQLFEQNRQTDNLMAFSEGLLESVRIFKLPTSDAQNETHAVEESLKVVNA
jgi:methyl-accepting chemotaxis protein